MTMRQFLKAYRLAIEQVAKENQAPRPTNDEEREEWILNDEGLYQAAMRAGVEV